MTHVLIIADIKYFNEEGNKNNLYIGSELAGGGEWAAPGGEKRLTKIRYFNFFITH